MTDSGGSPVFPEEGRAERPLGLWGTVVVLFATLVAGAVLAAVVVALFPGWPQIAQMALPSELVLFLAIVYLVRRSGRPVREALGLAPLAPRSLGPLALILIGSITVFSELYVIIQRVAPIPPIFEEFLADILSIDGPFDLVMTVAVAAIVAPVLEEILFRGAILQSLSRTRGPGSAAVWSAIFFALFHLYNPWQLLPTFFLGLLLAWIVLTTRSLVSAILIHAAFNGMSLGLYRVPTDVEPASELVPVIVIGIFLVLILASLALLVGMVWLESQEAGGRFGPGEGGSRLPSGGVYLADRSAAPETGPSTARG